VIESATRSSRLLVISGDSAILSVVISVARANRWVTETAGDAWEAVDKIYPGGAFDLLVLDMPNPASDGLPMVRALRRSRPSLPLVLIGRTGDLDLKREAIRMGARDYIARPIRHQQLEMAIKQNLPGADAGMEARFSSERGNEFILKESGVGENGGETQIPTAIVSPNRNRRRASSPQPFEGICGHKSLRSLLQSVKEEAEKNAIAVALEKTGWNRKAAARLLKTSYRSVLYKIEQYRMSSPNRSETQMDEQTDGAIAELGEDVRASAPDA
jgi:DNA-binding NtrC family response regulator